jgi:hypothetical protein
LLDHRHGAHRSRDAHRARHVGNGHIEHAFIHRHRPRDDHEVLVLVGAQHTHFQFLVRLHSAHFLDQRSATVRAAGDGFAVDRNDDVAITQPGFFRRPARAHAQHSRTALVARVVDLHSEHRVAIAGIDEEHVASRISAELARQLGDFARRFVEARARFIELGAGLGLVGFALGDFGGTRLEIRDLRVLSAAPRGACFGSDGRVLRDRRRARCQQTNQHQLFHEGSPKIHQKLALTSSA